MSVDLRPNFFVPAPVSPRILRRNPRSQYSLLICGQDLFFWSRGLKTLIQLGISSAYRHILRRAVYSRVRGYDSKPACSDLTGVKAWKHGVLYPLTCEQAVCSLSHRSTFFDSFFPTAPVF
jgi:hypothetical protein